MGTPADSAYFVRCSEKLAKLFADTTVEGMTISAPGFYAPRGATCASGGGPELNGKIERSSTRGTVLPISKEGSALAGLSRLLGHEATTICTVIAQRVALGMEPDYRPFVDKMIAMSLEKLSQI